MADNIELNSGSGGAIVAADDISSVWYQIVKLGIGALDSVTLLSGNSGNKDAGTVRVVIATDQPALTNKLLVTPDLPSGASTSAKQDTVITAVEAIQTAVEGTLTVDASGAAVPVTDNSGSLTVDAPVGTPVFVRLSDGSSAIATLPVSLASVPSHAVTNAGTFAVQVSSALPAGTNAIGKLSANSGVDIGDVDVTSLPATPAGTNAIGKLLPPDIDVTTHTNYIRKYYTSSGAATDGIVWSPAAGKRWHVTSLYFQVSADATVTFEDDKSGGDDPVLKGEYKAGSGLALTFGEKYPFASGEDAADLIVTTSAGNIYVVVVGYEI